MLTRLRGDAGVSLIELLIGMSVGMVILLALFNLVDQSFATSRGVSDRVESQQRGRVAMERIEQQLRSAVCVPSNTGNGALLNPIYSADDNQITFFTWLPQAWNDASTPIMRQLVYDPAAKTLTQKTWSGWTTPPDPTSAPPDATNGVVKLLTNVIADGTANPNNAAAFFGVSTIDGTAPLPTPVAASDVDTVARVSLGFQVGPVHQLGTSTSTWAHFSDDVTLRLPPSYSSGTATGGPQCTS